MRSTAYDTMLRKILQHYQLLEITSYMSSESINGSVNFIQAMPPFQPLAERLALMVTTTPRHWLKLRRVIRSLYSDILSSFSEAIQEALFYTDELMHAQQHHSKFSKLVTDHLQYILARRMVLKAIQYYIHAFAPTLEWRDNIQGLSDRPTRERHHHRQVCDAKQRNFEVLLFTLQQSYAIAQERWIWISKSPVNAGTILNPH